MNERDERRKLSELDYKAIRFAVQAQDRTIREVANSYGCSTKYIKRLINQTAVDMQLGVTCSGCGYVYPSMDEIQQHWAIWTSGGTHGLACGQTMMT